MHDARGTQIIPFPRGGNRRLEQATESCANVERSHLKEGVGGRVTNNGDKHGTTSLRGTWGEWHEAVHCQPLPTRKNLNLQGTVVWKTACPWPAPALKKGHSMP